MHKLTLRHFAFPIASLIGGALGVDYAYELDAHHVPLLTMVACCLAIFASVYTAVRWFVEVLSATTHKCRAAGCGFRVRVSSTDPGESRRWQEIAAAHPVHDQPHHRV
ncbi:hypothetical protein [Streptomyces sp. NPDC037389]|uniref:hypothetical protein n=1 Tax=Streptomyces sp. NPDC037389 TaxID=3155369 RepID=UPI0033CD5A96